MKKQCSGNISEWNTYDQYDERLASTRDLFISEWNTYDPYDERLASTHVTYSLVNGTHMTRMMKDWQAHT